MTPEELAAWQRFLNVLSEAAEALLRFKESYDSLKVREYLAHGAPYGLLPSAVRRWLDEQPEEPDASQ